MAASYSARALAIQSLTVDLRRKLELASIGTIVDKMAAIDLGVEVVNKILYCFLVSQELFDSVERIINPYYQALQPVPSVIDRFFNLLISVVRSLEAQAVIWVKRYR